MLTLINHNFGKFIFQVGIGMLVHPSKNLKLYALKFGVELVSNKNDDTFVFTIYLPGVFIIFVSTDSKVIKMCEDYTKELTNE